jgi:hypothetical protein
VVRKSSASSTLGMAEPLNCDHEAGISSSILRPTRFPFWVPSKTSTSWSTELARPTLWWRSAVHQKHAPDLLFLN